MTIPPVMDFARWLADTEVAYFLTDEEWAFPTVETLHVIFLCLVVGSIALVDLRLLGLTTRHRPTGEIIRTTIPITWIAFAGAATTGALLFCANPIGYAENTYFLIKLGVLGLAGANMLFFNLMAQPKLTGPNNSATTVLARVSGGLSLVFWVSIVTLGRWIGFTL